MINVIDYRRTIYDNDPPDYSGNKKILAERIKKDHPKVIDFHPQIRENEGGYKLSFIKAYDGNTISSNVDFIIKALKEYGLWEELCDDEHTRVGYRNIPISIGQIC